MELLYLYYDNPKRGFHEIEIDFNGSKHVKYSPEDQTCILEENDNYLAGFWTGNTREDANNCIQNINLIIGKNGSGKTTLLNILASDTTTFYENRYEKDAQWLIVYYEKEQDFYYLEGNLTSIVSNWELSLFGLSEFFYGYDDRKKKFEKVRKKELKKKTCYLFLKPSTKNDTSWTKKPDDEYYGNLRSSCIQRQITANESLAQVYYTWKHLNILDEFYNDKLQCTIRVSDINYSVVKEINDLYNLYTQFMNDQNLDENSLVDAFWSFSGLMSKRERFQLSCYEHIWAWALGMYADMENQHGDDIEALIYDVGNQITQMQNLARTSDSVHVYIENIRNVILRDLLKDVTSQSTAASFLKKVNDFCSFLGQIEDSYFVDIDTENTNDLWDYFISEVERKSLIEILIQNDSKYRKIIFELFNQIDAINSMYSGFANNSHFFSVEYDKLSDGEFQYIKLLSKISYSLREAKMNGADNIIFCMDEPDIRLHPEWSRRFISSLTSIVEDIGGLNVHFIITTHSPFMVSDVPGSNVTCIEVKKDKNTGVTSHSVYHHEGVGFGSNIYKIMESGFFIENAMGYYAERYINDIIRQLAEPEISDPAKLVKRIEMIEDDFIKSSLLKNLASRNVQGNGKELLIMSLEEEIARLKGQS